MLRETGDLPTETDVLVLGAGMAGHCTALAAAEAGAKVLFLEKSRQPGGSSAMAGGGFVFVGSEENPNDSLEAFRRDLFESGKHKNNPALVNAFIEHQLEAYKFLRAHGVKFSPDPSGPRMHTTGTGRAVTSLHMAALAHPNIRFMSKSAAGRLQRNAQSGRVDSALVYFGDKEATITAKRGVVLATGGFSRSQELVDTFAPELANAVRHGGIANTGDGLMMASALGAGLADLGYVSGSFGGAIRNYPQKVDASNDVPPLLFAFMAGGIMVNKHGRRFVNEGQSYKLLSNIGMAQPEGIGFQIFDQKLMDGSWEDTSVNNYKEGLIGGYIQKADTIESLAALMQIDPATLAATVARYNSDVAKGADSEFGRINNLMAVDKAPFYIAATGNALTSTYGGVTANGEMAVVDWFGEPIAGLYAAGEVVGGFHGAGYYSASSLASSATFGMLAGRAAAAQRTD